MTFGGRSKSFIMIISGEGSAKEMQSFLLNCKYYFVFSYQISMLHLSILRIPQLGDCCFAQ